jgi:hypothetical protein
MRKLTAGLTLIACSVVMFSSNGFAWGNDGHRIVAIIAEKHLTDAARTEARRLLGNNSLESVATFADDVRNSRPQTKNFHFVDIPLNVATFDPARHCQNSPNGDCVIAAIERFRATLADTTKSDADRAEALKFIVHLVGDMHQPLHCAERDNDRGGNAVKVTFLGKKSNLHAVWDSGIIREADLSDVEFADELEAAIKANEIDSIQRGTPITWANEAHKLAQTNAYKRVPKSGAILRVAYYNRNFAVVDSQLTKAGLRLAKVLNDALR